MLSLIDTYSNINFRFPRLIAENFTYPAEKYKSVI